MPLRWHRVAVNAEKVFFRQRVIITLTRWQIQCGLFFCLLHYLGLLSTSSFSSPSPILSSSSFSYSCSVSSSSPLPSSLSCLIINIIRNDDDEINLLYLLPLLILSFVLILLPVAAFSPENCLPSVILNGASRKSDHDFKQITFRGNRLKPRPDGLESSSPTQEFYIGVDAVEVFIKQWQTLERINGQVYLKQPTKAGADCHVLKSICNVLTV